MNIIFVLAVVGLAAAMVCGGLIVSRLFAPRIPNKTKATAYECGEKPVGTGQVQFNVAYYLFALVFLAFDVEALFLFPWAATFRKLGWVGFAEITFFIFILLAGLVYAYKKGALEWHG